MPYGRLRSASQLETLDAAARRTAKHLHLDPGLVAVRWPCERLLASRGLRHALPPPTAATRPRTRTFPPCGYTATRLLPHNMGRVEHGPILPAATSRGTCVLQEVARALGDDVVCVFRALSLVRPR